MESLCVLLTAMITPSKNDTFNVLFFNLFTYCYCCLELWQVLRRLLSMVLFIYLFITLFAVIIFIWCCLFINYCKHHCLVVYSVFGIKCCQRYCMWSQKEVTEHSVTKVELSAQLVEVANERKVRGRTFQHLHLWRSQNCFHDVSDNCFYFNATTYV